MTTPVVVLTIAGSDSSGGAGVQADLRTFAAHRVHGATAFTALTAQNTVGVQDVHPVPADFVRAQVDSVLADLDVAAVKTGMLGSEDNVRLVADLAAAGRLPNLVVDPVMVASTGARLLDPGAEAAYLDQLVPRARVATPNRAEAAALCGTTVSSTDEAAEAALALAARGPDAVIVTGGQHAGSEDEAVDVVALDGEIHLHRSPRLDTPNDHGTGCSFASAVAARLALGEELADAIDHARAFVHRALAGAARWRLGAGHGPVDHLGWGHQPTHQPSPSLREDP